MVDALQIVPISEACRREMFDCGVAALNDYLKKYARQNHDRNIARTFVAIDDKHQVLGYYSLAATVMAEIAGLPDNIAKRLPKYPIPATRLARLAVDQTVRGQRYGVRLLVDALKRIYRASADLGIKFVVVDATNESARDFYIHYGFEALRDMPMTLFLPIETVAQLVHPKSAAKSK